MSNKLYEENDIQAIANAIRGKNGSSDTYTVAQMAQAITNIPSGGGGYPPDWSQLGYSSTPQVLIDDFNYSKQIKDNWDSSTTSMYTAFSGDTNLRYFPLIDTSNVYHFGSAFSNCTNLIYVPVLNTSGAHNMDNTFSNATSLKTIPLIDTSNVTTMSSCFKSCRFLTIPKLNTSNVSNFGSTFSYNTYLVTIPALDTSSATRMASMFSGCKELQNVPLLNTEKVTSMSSMFATCFALSDESLNNILLMCANSAISSASNKTLKYIGLSSDQATTCQSLSNYQTFLDAGWTTGY